MRRVPQWFDEGVAVVVSQEPRQSEEVWQKIVESNTPHPKLDELASLKDWFAAVRKYGDEENAKGHLDRLSVVYATAGHEVRMWLQHVGQKGLLDLIARVGAGENFQATYDAIRNGDAISAAKNHLTPSNSSHAGSDKGCHEMSRSRRKTPITGHTNCRSERQDRMTWRQRWRARERTALNTLTPEGLDEHLPLKEDQVSNV